MGDDQSRKAFLKGFEEGLKSAWREIAGLMTRGYSSTELMVFAKSKMAVFGSLSYLAIALSTLLCGWLSDRMIARGASPTRVRKGFSSIGGSSESPLLSSTSSFLLTRLSSR